MKPSRKSRLKQRLLVSRKSVLFLAFYAVLVGASMSLDGKNELIFCRVALTTNFFAKLTPFLENKIVPKIGCSALLWNSTVSCTYCNGSGLFSKIEATTFAQHVRNISLPLIFSSPAGPKTEGDLPIQDNDTLFR